MGGSIPERSDDDESEIQEAAGFSPAKGAGDFDLELVRLSGGPGSDLLIGNEGIRSELSGSGGMSEIDGRHIGGLSSGFAENGGGKLNKALRPDKIGAK